MREAQTGWSGLESRFGLLDHPGASRHPSSRGGDKKRPPIRAAFFIVCEILTT